jgi:transposase-like protein
MRYSAGLKQEVVAAASDARSAGRAVRAIASRRGVRVTTLRRWLGTPEAGGGFRVVRVQRGRTRAGVSLVSPAGFRIEGLDLGAAATLLRLLG